MKPPTTPAEHHQDSATAPVRGLGAAQVEALVGDLEVSYGWRSDGPDAVRAALARLPASPAGECWRARLELLVVDDVVREHSAAAAAVATLAIRDRAASNGDRALRARAERAMSRLLRRIGDLPGSLEHAVAAMALDGEDLDATLRAGLRLAMADVLGESGSFGDARPWNREALQHAQRASTPWISLTVLNNWAYCEVLLGDLAAAWDLVEQMQALAAAHRARLLPVHVGTIAEVLHTLGRSGEAVTLLRERLRLDLPGTLADIAGCWLTLAQIERETGDLDAAATSLDTADHLSTTHQLHGLRVEGIGARAELLAARGDHAGAYETHLRFHEQTLALSTAASEARAQTLHATFEADTARREAARYREMSYRDPLTALLNRRHVDEDLDRRLASGEHLAIALVDLDHFKRVNDTFSHDVGDAVLTRLATLLEDAVTEVNDAYAARLGGEEFLLVLPHHDLAAAHAVAEGLRHQIATHDWHDIAPGTLITASTGLAHAGPGTHLGRAELLRTADTHLYDAKDGGRNRVEPSVRRPVPHHARAW